MGLIKERSEWLLVFFQLVLVSPHVFSQDSLFDSSFLIGAGANGPINAILVQQDGKILVGGEFTVIGGQTNAYLARLESDGRPDPSFESGTDGVVNQLLELPDGRILVAGAFTNLQGVARHGLGRLLTNGLADPSFDAGTNFESDEVVRTICVQPDDKIVTASDKEWSHFLLSHFSRFYPDGRLDASFVRTNGAFWYVLALLPLTDGTILAGGSFHGFGESGYSALALLRDDGQVDTNMAHVLTNYSSVFSLTKLTNGNILVGGLLNLAGLNRREVLAQLTPAWQWDRDFDTDEFKSGWDTYARSVLVQPDGKMVVAGVFQEVGGYWRRHIVRLDAQGHVDACFDPGLGLGNVEGARALARQNDGRILVGGSFDSREWAGVENLARLLPQGQCGVMRTYFIKTEEGAVAIGTCPPGGTNLLQMSTNLLDWQTLDTQTIPYVWSVVDGELPKAFFRVKKEF